MAQLRAEVTWLMRLLEAGQADGVISFVPGYHLYGFLHTVLLPAMARLPVWYLPLSWEGGGLPDGPRRPILVTTPAALTYLDRLPDLRSLYDRILLVHSTALLPPVGLRLLDRYPGELSLIEIFGSTETGGIAFRRPHHLDDPWELAPDVRFCEPIVQNRELPLVVKSPRVAYSASREAVHQWQTGDDVIIITERQFRFIGRRNGLVKVNGRRLYPEALEAGLREVIPCRDLACLPIRDDLRGEHFELVVVPDPAQPLEPSQVQTTCAALLGSSNVPRRIRFVSALERTALGKLRHSEGAIR